MTIADLLVIFKERFSKFSCSVVAEDLVAHDTSYLRYDSGNGNWDEPPLENIKVVNILGVETHIYPTDYTVDRAEGFITFTTPRVSTDIVRADYNKRPFTDAEITSILNSALVQVRVMCFHPITASFFSENYSEAILKKAYTIALREMQFPSTKYFAISISGRSIDKSNQVTQIEALIASNEKDLMQDINAIRYFDKTNVME